MKKFIWIFGGLSLSILSACDLQPKISSIPDNVGEFINVRYPALLADPETHPEIYNSAAADYGVYASPNLYGTPADDFVTYASVNDYIIPPQPVPEVAPVDSGAPIVANAAPDEYLTVPKYDDVKIVDDAPVTPTRITVAPGDTLYSLSRKYNSTVEEVARMNDLKMPYQLRVGMTLEVPGGANVAPPTPVAPVVATPNTTTRVALDEITVAPGDTLYSISRKYSVPVNDLAVMNKLSAPFTLSVGQKLRVPDLEAAPVKSQDTVAAEKARVASAYGTPPVKQASGTKTAQLDTAPVKVEKEKISSDPTKKLPKLTARSSSKFSWPVRGKILSAYGAKRGGLFNDGINIGAKRGTNVGAAENGVVAYAGNEVKGMGNLIIIQHAGGWMTVYAHMDSLAARRGARVNVGQKIGTVGATGKVDSPQLHFEIRKGTKAYNPSQYLKK